MTEEVTTVNLKVLSPSAEVEGGITFPDLPATTTIQELRSRIQDAVPSKPATERMRLIYRGRVVANDADTLGGVFGADNIRESKEQSLHLVLRELPTSGLPPSLFPRASTVPPNPFRPVQPPIPASPPLHTNPFRTVPQPRPGSQPQAPPPHHHHHHPHVHLHHPPGPPNPFQMPLPPAVQQHLAQTQQHIAQVMGETNAQATDPQAQSRPEGTPTQGEGPQPPPMGLPPLPGFGPPVFPPNIGRTVRQEGMGPNGERWSVTYSNANIFGQGQNAMLPPGFLQPPGFGMPLHPNGSPAASTEAIDRLLPQLRNMLQSARQDMESVRILLHVSGQQNAQPTPPFQANPPVWRLQRIRQHVQTMGHNLDLVERGLSVIAVDPAMTGNADVVALRQSANELRGQLADLDRMISQQNSAALAQAPSVENASLLSGASMPAPTPSSTSWPATQATTQTLPPNVPEELFILSSPQGPVGILFDQRGTYMTAPIVPTLPFQTFTNQFAQNRQLIAGIGQQMAQSSHHMHHPLANIQPTPTQPPTATGQAQNQSQPPAPGAEQHQPQDPNLAAPQAQAQNANANPPQADNDRIGNIFGHVWLVFKLACFVYFFSGTGWSKSLLLGFIAGCVYLAQLGLFDTQFALIRRHFEALLPVGGVAAQPAVQRRNTTPEEAARRLLQQQRRGGWVRESMRTVERAGAIFLASLWPGIGERMVHAQEERERVERVEAEEERARVEEERKRREETEKRESDEMEKEKIEKEAGASSKGKERVEEEVVAPVS